MDHASILVTGVGGRSVGHQVLYALSLAERPERYRILVADADPFSFGLYLGHRPFLLPSAHAPGYLDAIASLVRDEKIKAILPGTEPETHVLAGQSDWLRELGCRVVANPPGVVDLCSDKAKLDAWLNENGFSTPRTASLEHWPSLVEQVGFPIVGKPSRESGGSRGVMLLANEAEVAQYAVHAAAATIVQEYVPDEEHEYTVGVLVRPDGDSIIDTIVLRRKLVGLSLGAARTVGAQRYVLSTGYSQGFVVDNSIVRTRCEELALKLKAAGPLNIQCRLHGDDIKVFEVHPRFSGTTSIRASVGFNEPDVLLRSMLFNERIHSIDYRTGVAVIRAFQHVVVPAEDYLGEVPES